MAEPGSLSETPQASDYVAPDFAKLSGYGEGWYISPGWPGEYPAGFVVLDEGIRVMGRAKPNPASPQESWLTTVATPVCPSSSGESAPVVSSSDCANTGLSFLENEDVLERLALDVWNLGIVRGISYRHEKHRCLMLWSFEHIGEELHRRRCVCQRYQSHVVHGGDEHPC